MHRLAASRRFSEEIIQVSHPWRRVRLRRSIVRSRWNRGAFRRKSTPRRLVVRSRWNREAFPRKPAPRRLIVRSRWNRETFPRKPARRRLIVRSKWNRETFRRKPAARRVSSSLLASPRQNSSRNAAPRKSKKKSAVRSARIARIGVLALCSASHRGVECAAALQEPSSPRRRVRRRRA